MHERGLGVERLGGEDVGRLLLISDRDGLGGVEGLMTVLGDDHGNDLTDAADHAVDADERPVGGTRVRAAPVLDRPDTLGLTVAGGGPVRARKHRQHPRHGGRPRRFDARHCGVGMGAADKGRMGDGPVEARHPRRIGRGPGGSARPPGAGSPDRRTWAPSPRARRSSRRSPRACISLRWQPYQHEAVSQQTAPVRRMQRA